MTLIAPMAGGWLAEQNSFQAMFLVAVVGGLLTTFVLQFIVYDPRRERAKAAARMNRLKAETWGR
jgi:fructose-specific phosphotransferase system IIC component